MSAAPTPRILGQDRAMATLAQAMRSGRMHHAWVFAGPRGVGKCITAIEFARWLLDPQTSIGPGGAIRVDLDSRVSRMIDAGTHPDLHVIRKELAEVSSNPAIRERKQMNIPLDLLREFMVGGTTGDDRVHSAPVNLTAALGHGKVFIIDEAELLDLHGQNTLLKTLEEPPAQTYIVLVTSRPDRLLPTIRSRCQLVRFGALDEPAMRQWVQRQPPAAAGAPDGDGECSWSSLDPAQRQWVLQVAAGSPGAAALAAAYGFHHWWQQLQPMLVTLADGGYPASLGETMAALIDAFAQTWVKRHAGASKDAANKDGVRHLMALLAWYARQRLHDAVAAGAPADPWLERLDLLAATEAQLDANVNLKLAMENLAAQWWRAGAATAAA